MKQQEVKGNRESTRGGGWLEKVSKESSSVDQQKRRLHSREKLE